MAKQEKHYVSEVDRFLQELDKTVPPSPAQQEEAAKHRRIAILRDNPNAEQPKDLFDF